MNNTDYNFDEEGNLYFHFSLLIFSFNRDVKERTLQPYS